MPATPSHLALIEATSLPSPHPAPTARPTSPTTAHPRPQHLVPLDAVLDGGPTTVASNPPSSSDTAPNRPQTIHYRPGAITSAHARTHLPGPVALHRPAAINQQSGHGPSLAAASAPATTPPSSAVTSSSPASRTNSRHPPDHLAIAYMHNHRHVPQPGLSFAANILPTAVESSAFAPSPYTVSSETRPSLPRHAASPPLATGQPRPLNRSVFPRKYLSILSPVDTSQPYTHPMQAPEIELKFPVSDPAALQSRLPQLGFHLDTPRTFEHNTLYDTPTRDLRAKRELLRLRHYGTICTVTHKRQADQRRRRHALQSSHRDRNHRRRRPSPRRHLPAARLHPRLHLRKIPHRVVPPSTPSPTPSPTSSSTKPPSATTPNWKAHRLDRSNPGRPQHRPRHLPHRQLRQTLPRLEAAHRQPRRKPHLR